MAWVQEWGDLGTRRTRDGLEVTQQGRGSNPGNLLPSSGLSAALSSLPMQPGGPQALGEPDSQRPQPGLRFPACRGGRACALRPVMER